jgi:hypothetical protein
MAIDPQRRFFMRKILSIACAIVLSVAVYAQTQPAPAASEACTSCCKKQCADCCQGKCANCCQNSKQADAATAKPGEQSHHSSGCCHHGNMDMNKSSSGMAQHHDGEAGK